MRRVSGTLDELLTSKDRIIEFANAKNGVVQEIKDKGGEVVDQIKDKVYLKVKSDEELYNAIELGKSVGLQLIKITPRRETLEELFVNVIDSAKKERSS